MALVPRIRCMPHYQLQTNSPENYLNYSLSASKCGELQHIVVFT